MRACIVSITPTPIGHPARAPRYNTFRTKQIATSVVYGGSVGAVDRLTVVRFVASSPPHQSVYLYPCTVYLNKLPPSVCRLLVKVAPGSTADTARYTFSIVKFPKTFLLQPESIEA